MGILLRGKLALLPVVDMDNMAEAYLSSLASVGVESSVIKAIRKDHKQFVRKYCEDFYSLDDIHSHAQGGFFKCSGLYYTWRRVGPYLIQFMFTDAYVTLRFLLAYARDRTDVAAPSV